MSSSPQTSVEPPKFLGTEYEQPNHPLLAFLAAVASPGLAISSLTEPSSKIDPRWAAKDTGVMNDFARAATKVAPKAVERLGIRGIAAPPIGVAPESIARDLASFLRGKRSIISPAGGAAAAALMPFSVMGGEFGDNATAAATNAGLLHLGGELDQRILAHRLLKSVQKQQLARSATSAVKLPPIDVNAPFRGLGRPVGIAVAPSVLHYLFGTRKQAQMPVQAGMPSQVGQLPAQVGQLATPGHPAAANGAAGNQLSQAGIAQEYQRRMSNLEKTLQDPNTSLPDKLTLTGKVLKAMPETDPASTMNPLAALTQPGQAKMASCGDRVVAKVAGDGYLERRRVQRARVAVLVSKVAEILDLSPTEVAGAKVASIRGLIAGGLGAAGLGGALGDVVWQGGPSQWQWSNSVFNPVSYLRAYFPQGNGGRMPAGSGELVAAQAKKRLSFNPWDIPIDMSEADWQSHYDRVMADALQRRTLLDRQRQIAQLYAGGDMPQMGWPGQQRMVQASPQAQNRLPFGVVPKAFELPGLASGSPINFKPPTAAAPVPSAIG